MSLPLDGSSYSGTSGPLHQSSEEKSLLIDKNAFTKYQQENLLAIVKDNMKEVVPFTQQTYHEVFKYDTQPSKPSLHPLLNIRGSSTTTKKNNASALAYAKLLESLPSDIKEKLGIQNKLPINERDSNYVALNNFLKTTADGYAWIDQASTPLEPGSPADTQNQINARLPFLALQGYSFMAQEVAKETREILEELGHNHPQHDDIKALQDDIHNLSNKLDEIKQDVIKGSNKSRDMLKELSAEIDLTYNNYQNKELNGDFHLLGSQLYALNNLAHSLTIEHGSAPLVIGYALTGLGFDDSKSSLAMTGSGIGKSIESFANGISNLFDLTPGAEINEMSGLKEKLSEFRDQGE